MTNFLPKAVYFLYFAALACLVPFMSLYYQEQGMNGTQIGILSGLIPLITLIGSPTWGAIADTTRRHRVVLLVAISSLLAAVGVLFMVNTFYGLLAAVFAYAFFNSPIVPIVDNTVMHALGPNKGGYSRIRLWGAVGWGLAATALGPLLERMGLAGSFYGFWLFMGLTLLAAARLPVVLDNVGQSYTRGLRVLLRNGRFVLLLFVSLVIGISLGVLLSYLFIYIDQLGGSRTLMATSLVITTVAEIPFWFVGAWLLQRWGITKMVSLALLATIVRMFALALMTDPWVLLPISLLHGPMFAVMWAAGVAEADATAPPGLGATAQSMFSASMMGLGAALGGFLGGPAYERLGFPTLFAILGWMTVVTLIIYIIFRLWPKQRGRPALASPKSE